MILVETILGSEHDAAWTARLAEAEVDMLLLDQWDAQKSRLRKTTVGGAELALRGGWQQARRGCGEANAISGGHAPRAGQGVARPATGQRIGGAYISPPWFHSRFRPRSSPIGEFGPRCRSKISP